MNTQINDTLLDKDHTFSSNEFSMLIYLALEMQSLYFLLPVDLDKRLVKALSGMGFIHPTVVQVHCSFPLSSSL